MRSSETLLLERFNQIIENNFHKSDFSIDEICVELGTSRSQLYRHIKEQTQLSTSLYIRHRKLLKAKELLEFSEMKTVEIAYQLGIDSPQNFSKYFVQEFGITPTAYRKQVLEGKLVVADPNEAPEQILQSITDSSQVEVSSQVKVAAKPSMVTVKRPGFFDQKWLVAGILLIAGIAAGFYFWKSLEEKKQANALLPVFSENSIAIMPFENLGTPETAYFCDGIMDQIHGTLARINKLKVISTTSSAKYKNSNKLAPQIARELDVNYILEGSVLQAYKKIRINVELVRASDDRTVWTKSYDGDTKDVFTYLNTVSKEVANELDQKLSYEAEKKLDRVPTSNPEAYNEYLKGAQLILSRTKEPLEEAIVKLSKAIALDPDFAAAYANRALAYYLLGESDHMDEAESFRKTEQNSLTAIRLDPENGLAYANLANIYRAQNKWEQAKTAYQIALKYSPNDAIINYWFGVLLSATGDAEGAMRYNARAVALDPLYHVIFGGSIMNYVYGGELELAKKQIEEGKVLFKDSWVYHWHSASYYGAKKDYKQALKCYEMANKLNPGIRSIQYQMVYYKALDGQIDAVNAYLKNLPDLPVNYISRAVIYAGLKNKKDCLYYFKKAAERGIIQSNVKLAPYMSIIRDEPDYKTTLAKFGL